VEARVGGGRPGVRWARDETIDGARRACASGDDGVAVCGAAAATFEGEGERNPIAWVLIDGVATDRVWVNSDKSTRSGRRGARESLEKARGDRSQR